MKSESVRNDTSKLQSRYSGWEHHRQLSEFWQRPSFVTLTMTAWVLAMVGLPIATWIWGDSALPPGLTVGVTLQAAAVFLILRNRWGWLRTAKTAVTIAMLAFLVEWLGSSTGFPFGPYSYSNLMQPQITHVPILIPAAWFMMLPPAWAAASVIQERLPQKWQNKSWLFALLAGVAFTAWDLLLDPQMVAWGLWQWENPTGYFGIPWSNYAGWLAAAVLFTRILNPKNLPIRPLLLIYTITWFLETFGLLFFWGLAGPALVGGFVMGAFVWLSWRPFLREKG